MILRRSYTDYALSLAGMEQSFCYFDAEEKYKVLLSPMPGSKTYITMAYNPNVGKKVSPVEAVNILELLGIPVADHVALDGFPGVSRFISHNMFEPRDEFS